MVQQDALLHRVSGDPVVGKVWEDERAQMLELLMRDGVLGSQTKLKVGPLAIATILELHPYWRGSIRYNELTDAYECAGQRLTDAFATRVGHWFERQWHAHSIKRGDIEQQYEFVARKNKYHPVRDMLCSTPWDGTKRASALHDALSATKDNKGLHLAYLEAWLAGAVRRIFEPGSKMDAMLVLQGNQGIRKSTFWHDLVGGTPAYNELGEDQWSKAEVIHAAWVHEFAELESVTTKAEVGALKSHLSRRADTFRPAYGRRVLYKERACAFVGTTNEVTFLRDRTGNRRFWIIPCRGQIDIDWVRENRLQIWAEAVARYKSGAGAWLGTLEAEQASLVLDNVAEDPWDQLIDDFLLRQQGSPFHTNDVLKHLDVDPARRVLADSQRVGALLRARGYESGSVRVGSTFFKGWKRAL